MSGLLAAELGNRQSVAHHRGNDVICVTRNGDGTHGIQGPRSFRGLEIALESENIQFLR
jgi:3-dehydroquinate synthase class II